METASIVLVQVLIILALIIVGAISHKANLISVKAADDMAAVCLKIVTPCVIINAFQIPFNKETLNNMLMALFLAVLTHVLAIIISKIFFPKKDGDSKVLRFAVVYSNCGFMGIPLVEGVVGSEGVLYVSIYIVVFTALMWSHGVVTIKGSAKAVKLHKIFINPGTIGIAIALPLFFMSTSLPPVLKETVSHIAKLNTPLSMIVSGVFIARSKLFEAFIRPKFYVSVFLKHLVIPLLTMLAIFILRPDEKVALTMLLLSACPTASGVTLFTTQFGTKNELTTASRVLTLSSVLALLTIPVIALVYGAIM